MSVRKHQPKIVQEHLVKIFAGTIVFLLILFLASLFTRGFTVFSITPSDEFIFLTNSECETCADAKFVVQRIALENGLPFKESIHDAPEFLPGFIVVHNGHTLVSLYRDENVVERQVTGFIAETS